MGWNMDDWGDGVDADEACEVRGARYQDMCVSVYSIFSIERTSWRGTPHYIGLRGYSTGGRYADAIGLGG